MYSTGGGFDLEEWKISPANSNTIEKQIEFAFLRFWYLADAFILAYISQRQTDSQTEQCGRHREETITGRQSVPYFCFLIAVMMTQAL